MDDYKVDDKVDAKKEDEEPPVEYFCGIGKFRPKFLQIFRDAKFFTFLLCCNCFIEGTLNTGFISVVLSTLERRYQVSGLQAGLIASVLDMAILVSVVFISYFAGKGHKPRFLGVSLIIQGFGALVFALPEFVFGEYITSETTERLEACNDTIDFSADCDIRGNNQYSLVFFYIASMLNGVGAAALFTVGPAYIDDIVHPKYVPVHLGIFYTWAILGPALGFGLGAAFLSVYVDFWVDTDLTDADPSWVGAWWLCFLFAAIVSWLLSIPFLMFPKLLPNSQEVKAERQEEMTQKLKRQHRDPIVEVSALEKIKSFPLHAFQVFTTPSWLFITIGICFGAFVATGITAFAPKYYETQYSLSSSLSSIAAGAIAIPTGAAGAMMGALIIFFTKAKGRSVVAISWTVTLLAIPFLFGFLASCPTTQLVGVNVPFPDGVKLKTLAGPTFATCNYVNPNCSCTSPIYEPVCGGDELTYFSPCTAGCDKAYINNDRSRPVFENCTCIRDNFAVQQFFGSNRTMNFSDFQTDELLSMSSAQQGECDTGCYGLGIFLATSVFSLFLLFALQVPNIVITIRCVADEHRALALGMQSFFFRLFGSVPGPIVFGVVFDLACIHFRYDIPCDKVGNCWVYDNHQLSWTLLVMVVIGITANFVFTFIAWLVYPRKDVSGKLAEEELAKATTEMASLEQPKLETVDSQRALVNSAN